jgi:lactate dehydrogenase-like 2-hydroxyacid dehydrogenase
LDACRRRGIAVTNTPDVLTNATAELALALSLAAARRMSDAEADLRAGRWRGWDPGANLGLELTGATFGIVGLGRIGRRYAELVKGFAGELLYASPTRKREAEGELGAEWVPLEEIVRRADVLSLHLPATEETAGLIGERELSAMKSHAVLVNTSRGPLVDSNALARALREGGLGAAGLDVYENEPEVPPALLEAPRCVLLPHIGSATTRSRDGMARLVADNVLAVLAGGHAPNRVA